MTKPTTLSERCFTCGRIARPGIKCVSFWCPWEREVRFGDYVLSRPLRRRFIT